MGRMAVVLVIIGTLTNRLLNVHIVYKGQHEKNLSVKHNNCSVKTNLYKGYISYFYKSLNKLNPAFMTGHV